MHGFHKNGHRTASARTESRRFDDHHPASLNLHQPGVGEVRFRLDRQDIWLQLEAHALNRRHARTSCLERCRRFVVRALKRRARRRGVTEVLQALHEVFPRVPLVVLSSEEIISTCIYLETI